ncbi:MAG: TetR/AcrR family transcriptional regulator [Clostridia bacterium]|nr:TetR/AcrR family transcriptional regulator [Clostridia bacterium]
MAKSTNAKQTKKVTRKAQIIKSALKVFCVKGYDATTVDDIVKKAGCSHGLFYHYFTNKQEVFNAVLEQHQNRHVRNVNAKIKDVPSYREKLKIALLDLIDEYATNDDLAYYFYFFLSQAFNIKANDLPLPDLCQGPRAKTVELFYNIIKEGRDCGEFSTKHTVIEDVVILFSIVVGTAVSYVVAPKEIYAKIPMPNVDYVLDIFTGETK